MVDFLENTQICQAKQHVWKLLDYPHYIPASTWSNKRNLMTAVNNKANVLQNRSVGMVSKRYVLEFNLTTLEDQILSIRGILNLYIALE